MLIFLAAPLTQMLDPKTGQIDGEYRTWLEALMRELEGAGHKIASAHRREQWGANLQTPSEALQADLTELEAADAIVAHVGSPPSPGVQFELGAATVLGIPIVLLVDRGKGSPYLLPGLRSVAETESVELAPGELPCDRIEAALARIAA